MTGILWPLHVFGGVIWLVVQAAGLLLPPTSVKLRKALTGIGHLFMLIVLGTGFYALSARGGVALTAGGDETLIGVKIISAISLIAVGVGLMIARKRGAADRAKRFGYIGLGLIAVIAYTVVGLLQ